MISGRTRGFAIIEILIAITILATAMLGIISGVSAGILTIAGNKNMTRAMIIARSTLNEFQMNKMKEMDTQEEPVKEYPGFYISRHVKRFEHELFGPIDAQRVEIIVSWEENNNKKTYTMSYIYQGK